MVKNVHNITNRYLRFPLQQKWFDFIYIQEQSRHHSLTTTVKHGWLCFFKWFSFVCFWSNIKTTKSTQLPALISLCPISQSTEDQACGFWWSVRDQLASLLTNKGDRYCKRLNYFSTGVAITAGCVVKHFPLYFSLYLCLFWVKPVVKSSKNTKHALCDWRQTVSKRTVRCKCCL